MYNLKLICKIIFTSKNYLGVTSIIMDLTKEIISAHFINYQLLTSTFEYINDIFLPYLNFYKKTSNIEDLHDMINKNFIEKDKYLVENYESFIMVLLTEIASNIISNLYFNDLLITPWDVLKAIKNNKNLAKIFDHKPDDDYKLTIYISHDYLKYIADVEEEFVYGFLTFISNYLPNNLQDKIIFLYKSPITLLRSGGFYNRYMKNIQNDTNNYKYSVMINNNQYIFNTSKFLKGFKSAMMLLCNLTSTSGILTDIKEYSSKDGELTIKDMYIETPENINI
jgi:hypothetical protein